MAIGITITVLLIAFLLWYAIKGRQWLKSKSWAAPFFAWIEPIEIALYRKSEVILLARLKVVSGVLLTLLTQVGQIDLTPIMPLVPDKYAGYVRTAFNSLPLVLSFIGMIDEKLRNITTLPIEIVAVPDKLVTPKVAEAIAMADQTKTEAVAAVAEAKAA